MGISSFGGGGGAYIRLLASFPRSVFGLVLTVLCDSLLHT